MALSDPDDGDGRGIYDAVSNENERLIGASDDIGSVLGPVLFNERAGRRREVRRIRRLRKKRLIQAWAAVACCAVYVGPLLLDYRVFSWHGTCSFLVAWALLSDLLCTALYAICVRCCCAGEPYLPELPPGEGQRLVGGDGAADWMYREQERRLAVRRWAKWRSLARLSLCLWKTLATLFIALALHNVSLINGLRPLPPHHVHGLDAGCQQSLAVFGLAWTVIVINGLYLVYSALRGCLALIRRNDRARFMGAERAPLPNQFDEEEEEDREEEEEEGEDEEEEEEEREEGQYEEENELNESRINTNQENEEEEGDEEINNNDNEEEENDDGEDDGDSSVEEESVGETEEDDEENGNNSPEVQVSPLSTSDLVSAAGLQVIDNALGVHPAEWEELQAAIALQADFDQRQREQDPNAEDTRPNRPPRRSGLRHLSRTRTLTYGELCRPKSGKSRARVIANAAAAEIECSICLMEFQADEQIRQLKCLHLFHVQCIDRWFANRNTCPVCKQTVARARPQLAGARLKLRKRRAKTSPAPASTSMLDSSASTSISSSSSTSILPSNSAAVSTNNSSNGTRLTSLSSSLPVSSSSSSSSSSTSSSSNRNNENAGSTIASSSSSSNRRLFSSTSSTSHSNE